MPPVKRSQMPPAVRMVDNAKSCLQHLADQERLITSRVVPPEDPVEAVFKPPEALPHSYLVSGSRKKAGNSALAAPVGVKLPKALATLTGGLAGQAKL